MHAVGVRHAQCEGFPHVDRCRDRIGELMAEDDDQRQVERVSGTVHPEVETSRPGAGEEMDVGEPMVVEDQQPVQKTVPTVRVVDHQAQEPDPDQVQEQMQRTQMIVKRNVSDSQRGQKRQGEDVEELTAMGEEQHPDADVEVPEGRRRCRRCGRRSARTNEQLRAAQDRSVREDRRITQTT